MNKADIINVQEQDTVATAKTNAATPSNKIASGGDRVRGAAEERVRVRREARSSGVGSKNAGWVGSTKLSRLEFELCEMKRQRAGAKAVVFSQVGLDGGGEATRGSGRVRGVGCGARTVGGGMA